MKQEEILSEALHLLRQAGVRISNGNLSKLSLTMPDGTLRVVTVRVAVVPPTPSMTASCLQREERQLVVTRRPSRNATKAAEQDELDLITIQPASVIIGGKDLLGSNELAAVGPTPLRGKPAWGRWAVVRALLLSDKPLIQRELAVCAGISQPAVTKNLQWLHDYVARTDRGWLAIDKAALLSFLMSHYPGPGGAMSHWYSLGPLDDQVRHATVYSEDTGAQPLLSGDVAADHYAPWRLPHRAMLYLRGFVDLSHAGFSPASRAEATLTTVVSEDQTLWLTAPAAAPGGLRLADPLITLWGISLDGAPDTPDAVEHLSQAIVSGVIP